MHEMKKNTLLFSFVIGVTSKRLIVWIGVCLVCVCNFHVDETHLQCISTDAELQLVWWCVSQENAFTQTFCCSFFSLSVFYLSLFCPQGTNITHIHTGHFTYSHNTHFSGCYCWILQILIHSCFFAPFSITLYFFMYLQQELLEYKWENLNGCCLFDITHLESTQPGLFWYWTATFHNKIYSYWIYFNWNILFYSNINLIEVKWVWMLFHVDFKCM